MLEDAAGCFIVSRVVTKCHGVSQGVTRCHNTPQPGFEVSIDCIVSFVYDDDNYICIMQLITAVFNGKVLTHILAVKHRVLPHKI